MGGIQSLGRVCVNPYTFSEGKFAGGVEAEANCSLARMQSGRNFRDIPQPRAEKTTFLPGRYLYAGPLWNHFGHILVDSLHRLWAYDGHDAIVFSGVVGLRGVNTPDDLRLWAYPPIVDKLLSIMGIDAPVFIVREPVTFEHLDVPEAGAIWKMHIMAFYREHLRRYQRDIEMLTGDVEPTGRRLYYPRTHLLSDGGILGSSYFASVLSANGFTVCHPEKLSLEQQFANLLKTDQIVFDEGSSVHLSELFDYLPAKAYMLPRRADDDVFCRALNPRGGMINLVDPDNVETLLDRNGSKSPASLAFYRFPELVYKRMADLGLINTQFDVDAYRRAEMADLLSAAAKDKALRQSRVDRLNECRSVVS